MNIYTENKACNPTVSDAIEDLNKFAKDLDVTHLKEMKNIESIEQFVNLFESLNSDEKQEDKKQLQDAIECIKNVYNHDIRVGKIYGDAELTEEMVLYAASNCLNKKR
jgi:S-adenosylmethionine hydrolase